MFEVLTALHLFAIALIIYTLVSMFGGESTYGQKLMIFFILAEFLHNAGFILEMLSKSQETALMAVKME